MALSSSDSDLSSDWAVISKCEETMNTDDDNQIDSQESCTRRTENKDSRKGTKVEDIILEQELPVLNDSSSSDIDIIEENFDDNLTGFVQPPPVLSLSTSLETSTLGSSENSVIGNSESSVAVTSENSIVETSESGVNETSEKNVTELSEHIIGGTTSEEERGRNHLAADTPNIARWFLNRIVEYWNSGPEEIITLKWTIAILILTFSVCLCMQWTLSSDFENARVMTHMKELVRELQFESRDLKNQMISEIKNEKIFAIFASQVKELKSENLKLTRTLQEVILELQKQSAFHEKEMERKQMESRNLYNDEINKLKEQINILQFDNEELQKQLVRMRYGSYSSESQKKNEAADENAAKEDLDSEKSEENSSESLTDEVKELKKDLHEEVLKLKKWNDLIELLVKNLQKSSENKESEYEEQKSEGKMSNDYKEPHWSWKDFKKSLKGTFNDFPDLFTKYMNYNRKRVQGAFKSVRHYFKVAQEETQKILNSNAFDLNKGNEVRKDVWKTMEALGEKWSELGDKWNEFFKMNSDEKKSSQEGNYDTPEFSNSYFEQSHNREEDKANFREHRHQSKYENKIPNEMPTFSQAEEYLSKKHDHHPQKEKSEWNFKKSNERKFHDKDHKKDGAYNSNSWMFKRAAYRAEIRQNDEDSPINWYLRRRKEEEYDEFSPTSEQAYMEEGNDGADYGFKVRGKQANDEN